MYPNPLSGAMKWKDEEPIMDQNEILENAVYGVMLSSGQAVSIAEVNPGEKLFDCARRNIGCDWVEVVEPEALSDKNYVILIDEEAKLKGNMHFVNCIASYLYESPEHGDIIIGNAMIVKAEEESLRLLTEAEALDLAKDMSQIRKTAIHEMTEYLSNRKMSEIKPEKSISAILRMGSEIGNRQPCCSEELER